MTQTMNTNSIVSNSFSTAKNEWQSAAGPLKIPLTNDYLFRALLQHNNHVLKGLICSLLHLLPSKVHSAVITNPIILGESINDKTFFLDISVTLNNNTLINLEMQVINERNWPERSLSYLGRTFDNLNAGADYSAVKPAIQIGILNFTLFPEYPEFYSSYQFMNTKNHTIYSDKMHLYVLNLTRIDLATKEDQQSHLDDWASIFKAATWEELKMIAKQDEFINEACSTIYQLSQEETIRLQCEAREDFYRRQRSVQSMLDAKISKIESLNITIEQQNATIEKQNTAIESKNVTIKNQNATIENQNTTIESQNTTIENQNTTIKELTDEIASLREQLNHPSKI